MSLDLCSPPVPCALLLKDESPERPWRPRQRRRRDARSLQDVQPADQRSPLHEPGGVHAIAEALVQAPDRSVAELVPRPQLGDSGCFGGGDLRALDGPRDAAPAPLGADAGEPVLGAVRTLVEDAEADDDVAGERR